MKTKREEACSKDSIILKPKPQCTFKAQCESAKSKMYATSQKDNVPVRTWNRSEFRTRISLFHCFISLKIVVLSFLSQTVYVIHTMYICARSSTGVDRFLYNTLTNICRWYQIYLLIRGNAPLENWTFSFAKKNNKFAEYRAFRIHLHSTNC